MWKEILLKKLNFENDNYYLSYSLRPVVCIKVVKKPLLEEVKNNLILKFKKNLIGESKITLLEEKIKENNLVQFKRNNKLKIQNNLIKIRGN